MRRGVLMVGASLVISRWWWVSILSSEAGDPGVEEESDLESSLICAAERTRVGSTCTRC